MTSQKLSPLHKSKLAAIKKELSSTRWSESNFIKGELLFYEAISIARENSNDESENPLLAALKEVQFNQYQQTQAIFKKNTQRERTISRFINRVKIVLTAGINAS